MQKIKINLNIYRILGILVFGLMVRVSEAQQNPMYTQYMFNTQTINPAYAGTWESMGFLVLGRQQWTGWKGAPETYTFSFQTPMRKEKVALGLNVISDKVGFEKRFSLFVDYSYKLNVSEKTKLRLGLKGGFSNYSHNYSAYTMYPGDGVDPVFQGAINNKFIPNFGVGAFLYNTRYYVGLSAPKIIHSKFNDNNNNFSVESEVRHYYLIAGWVFDLGENLKFKPTFLTKATVAPVEFDFTANFLLKEKLWLGAMYRTGDSFGFIAQWVFDKKLRVGYAIEFTSTKLRNHHNGTHEIMVSYELRTLKEIFVSPRYF